MRSNWLENVSHQILAPINGIRAQAENLSRSFRAWEKTNPQRIENSLATLVELSDWATRLTRNFHWVASEQGQSKNITLSLEKDFLGKIIEYTRTVQGLAHAKDISRINVDAEEIKKLNGKVMIDNQLFKQAVVNLLDNAIKYASTKSEISVTSSLLPNLAKLAIVNHDFDLRERD